MYQYLIANTLTREPWGTLDALDVSFSDPLNDAGQLSGTLSVGTGTELSTLRTLMEQDLCSIFVCDGPSILWSGFVRQLTWNSKSRTVAMTAVQSEQWLSERIVGIDTGAAPVKWIGVDQTVIAHQLIGYAQTTYGVPSIITEYTESGVPRDLILESQSYTDVKGVLDGMANRDNGFSWSIEARFGTPDGWPRLYFKTYYPERLSTPIFHLYSTLRGANVTYDSWPIDTTDRRTRVFALGDGEVPAQMYYQATDADTVAGKRLLREKSTSYSGQGITDIGTLQAHADEELRALKTTTGTFSCEVVTGIGPEPKDYYTGDRMSVTIQDEFLDVYLPAARIVDRSIRDEDRSNVLSTTLTFDLNDTEA